MILNMSPSVPSKYVSDILQSEDAFMVEEYEHLHTKYK